MKKLYVGLDVHKKFCQAVVMTESGDVIKREKIRTCMDDIVEFFRDLPPSVVAVESSGLVEPVYNWITGAKSEHGSSGNGHVVKVSHPLKTRAIASARIKTDKIDAEILANLARTDLLPESYIPPMDIRELRDLCRERANYVRERAKWKTRLKAELARLGISPPIDDIFTDAGMRWLTSIAEKLRTNKSEKILNMISTIKFESMIIKRIDERIESAAAGNKYIRILKSIKGIGTYSASLIYSGIGDINRFPTPEHLCSYAGLVPSTHQSGNTIRHGRITKNGSKYLRWILTECVKVHINKCDSSITGFYRRLRRSKGTQKATVAAARKLLLAIYWMMKEGREFEPFPDIPKGTKRQNSEQRTANSE